MLRYKNWRQVLISINKNPKPATPGDYLRRIRKLAIEFHDNALPQFKHDDIQRLLEEVGFVTRLNWNGKSRFGYIYARRD